MKYILGMLSVIISIGVAVLVCPPAGSSATTLSTAVTPISVTTAAPSTVTSTVIPTLSESGDAIAVDNSVAPAAATVATMQPAAPAKPSTPATSAAGDRAAYINAMYLSVVPAAERAAMAGRYVLGYNLPALSCGTGCTGMFGAQARSSFDDAFFTQSPSYQRNTIAHEAAHAYGFLTFADYATPSWAAVGGWQTQFHTADRSFAGSYDAEAWASCVAWKESGFNNLVNQISHVCTSQAAALAVAQIA
jgi:hypothetical protein